jgi:GTP pyrophosphokinase
VGYLGRGEGLVVHMHDCQVARRLRHKDAERFIGVEWSEEPVRSFKTSITVTGSNSKGMLAKMATALAAAEADIIDIDMGQEGGQEARQLRFLVSVRDTAHLEVALRNLRHTPSVIKAERSGAAGSAEPG